MDVTTGPHGPASQALINWLKGIFGKAFSVSRGYSGAHDGIDLPAKEGTPIRALKSGVVSYARDARIAPDKGSSGWAIGGGNVVNVDIGGKLTTQYAHLKSINVKVGQHVNAGDIIGTVGRTGGTNSSGNPGGAGSTFSGPHLHFGLWDKNINKMVNPQRFLENLKLTGKEQDDQSNLGGFDNLINFPVGHILTAADVEHILDVISKAGWFQGDSFFGGTYAKAKDILLAHVGEPWSKTLQDALQAEFFGAANTADPIGMVGNAIGSVGQQLSDTFTWIGFIIVGVVLIGGGIYLLGGRTGNG